MRAKLGLDDDRPGDAELVDDLLALLHAHSVDFTSTFPALSASLGGDDARVRALFTDGAGFDPWAARWRARLSSQPHDIRAVAACMDRVNPVYIPRNHKVEEALAAATAGDLEPFRRLVDVVTRPFDERPGLEPYAEPSPSGSRGYRTFCGT